MAEEINGVPCEKLFGAIAKFRENGELAAFKLSPLGTHLLGGGPQPLAEESAPGGGRVVVQPRRGNPMRSVRRSPPGRRIR